MTDPEPDLSPAEQALLLDAQTGNVSFVWVLNDLGLRDNPPSSPDWLPGPQEIGSAFETLERLHNQGLIKVGRIEYIDNGPSGWVAPLRHIAEPLAVVRQRVEAEVAAATQPSDWEFACWVAAAHRAGT